MRSVFLGLIIGLVTFFAGISVASFARSESGFSNADPVTVSGTEVFEVRNSGPNESLNNLGSEIGDLEELIQLKELPFDPSGNYYPEVDPRSDLHIQIDLEARKKRDGYIAWGKVVYQSEVYSFATVSVNKNRWTFKTKKVNGIEFRFDGRFLKHGNFRQETYDQGDASRVEGTLQKLINGKKVAEVKSPLRVYPGC